MARRNKTSSIGSGRSITQEIYDSMLLSYTEHRSIEQAATDAGISYETAKKYVNRGSKKFPAIGPRVNAIMERARKEQDAVLVQQRKFFVESVLDLASKAADALPNLQLLPKHQHIIDENGEIIRGKNGKPLMGVDEASMGKIVDVFTKVADLVERLANPGGVASPGGQQTINVQTNIVLDHKAVETEAQVALEKLGHVQSLVIGTDEENEVRQVLTVEAKRRAQVHELQDVEVLEEEEDG